MLGLGGVLSDVVLKPWSVETPESGAELQAYQAKLQVARPHLVQTRLL